MEMEEVVDRISDLPDNVTDQILSCLPIKDAARTSVLSTRWRCRWETVPCLVLNNLSFPIPKDDIGFYTIDKLVRNIDRLLLLHSGPILEFKLSYYSLSIPIDEIDKWIRRASSTSLREFEFCIPHLELDYKIPYCVFACRNLAHLSLNTCLLRPPSTFKGFANLKSLKLRSVTVTQVALECLVSGSPALQSLELAEVNGLSVVNIDAPNLQSLFVSGDEFVDYRLKNTSRLHVFYMAFNNLVEDIQNVYHGNFDDFVKLLADAPQIRELGVECSSFEYMAFGNVPRELPVHCFHLGSLSIGINLNSRDETSALLCLLRSVPNLQTLQLKLWDEGDGARETSSEVWQAEHWNCPFTRLRRIRIGCSGEPKVGMDFVRFMLSTTPVLESLVFSIENLYDAEKKFEIVTQLCYFVRVSPTATVIFRSG